ncbi:recombinase family protein [Macrococcoides caseolyticum]|uniref:recombinase family protein n=1 Tax=Macrococcoides caseolyticum TaxID=69966 RepID=UPI0018E2E348|nr:recombinase family protein [Macrococcus caseolyticus]
MKTIGLYCRVSTNEQMEQGYSLEMQEKLLIEEVVTNYPGYAYECYVDGGISGKNMTDRPEMQRLLKDVNDGKLNMVMSWKFSRISRSQTDQHIFADTLKRNGVHYRALAEGIDTKNDEESSDILMTIFGLQSSLERKTLIKNTKMGISAKASKGEPISGRAFGYDLMINQQTRKSELIINPYEANIVRQMFDMYLNKDMGLKAITNHLNKSGYKTIRGRPFSVFTTKYMLQNPLYKGMIRHHTNTNWNVKKSRRDRHPDDIKLYDGKHEAIIDPVVFDKVQEKFATRSFQPGRPASNDFYLRGLISCPGCGQKMVCRRTYYKRKDGSRTMKKYYICSLFNRSGSSVCSSHSIRSEVVEDIVKSHLSVLMNQQHVIDKIVDKYMNLINIDKTDNTINYNSVLKRQDELIKQKEKVLDLYLSGPFDKEMLDKKINVISTELKTVEDQLKESHVLSTTQKDTVNPEQIKTLLSKLFTNFDDVFNQSTGDQKNQLLRMLIEKIELTNDKQVKRVTYKIDAEDVPQSLKNDCGIFYFPNIHYNVNPDFTKIEFISI